MRNLIASLKNRKEDNSVSQNPNIPISTPFLQKMIGTTLQNQEEDSSEESLPKKNSKKIQIPSDHNKREESSDEILPKSNKRKISPDSSSDQLTNRKEYSSSETSSKEISKFTTSSQHEKEKNPEHTTPYKKR